jgi:hypothetical protein
MKAAAQGTDLARKMRARADKDKLPGDHLLRVRADEFDQASLKYLAQPQQMAVRAFMGFWGRARRTWCDYTGESLL